jgi:endonuclease YncB( thermonuclease family)
MLRILPCLLLVAMTTTALADPLPVQPTRVSDGDTFTARFESGNTGPVRLAGCDTPERGQAFGRRATEALKSILSTGPVVVDCYKVDRYGRGVCRVNASGDDVCLSLIRTGMAWHYAAYASEQSPATAEAYAQAQEAAQVARVGLWQDPSPVAPWDWRKAHSGPRKRPLEAPDLDQ